MGQSLSNVLVHFVFATKGRTPWLKDPWRNDFHDYLGGVVRKCGASLIIANSVEDHVHLLLPLPRTCSIADMMKAVKSGTSAWVHRTHPEMIGFEWQAGYGAFSVSQSHSEAVVKYIANQQEHHRQVSFQDEFRRLLELYKVKYDEAYLWD